MSVWLAVRRFLAPVLIVVFVGIAVVAAASPQIARQLGAPVLVEDLPGQTLDAASGVVNRTGVTEFVILDLSTPVLGRTPTYQGTNDAGYLILAACADTPDIRDATSLEVAVVALDDADGDVREMIGSGGYDPDPWCEGRPHGIG